MKRSTTLLACSACLAILLLFGMLIADRDSGPTVVNSAPAEEKIAELPDLPLGETEAETIAAIELEGTGFPRDPAYADYPPYPLDESLSLIGRSERACVTVPTERGNIVRSGEFVIGGLFSRLTHGRGMKIWWRPLNSTMDMRLLVRGRLLADEPATMRFESDDVTAPLHTDTLEPYADEASFPTGTVFPSAGRWVVVATSRQNWGCFVFDVM